MLSDIVNGCDSVEKAHGNIGKTGGKSDSSEMRPLLRSIVISTLKLDHRSKPTCLRDTISEEDNVIVVGKYVSSFSFLFLF